MLELSQYYNENLSKFSYLLRPAYNYYKDGCRINICAYGDYIGDAKNNLKKEISALIFSIDSSIHKNFLISNTEKNNNNFSISYVASGENSSILINAIGETEEEAKEKLFRNSEGIKFILKTLLEYSEKDLYINTELFDEDIK